MIKLYEKGIYLLRGEEIVTEEDRERLAALSPEELVRSDKAEGP